MRSFITALAMVAVATTSFAIGRSTSGSGMKPAVTETSVSVDAGRMQSKIGDLPEMRVDFPY